MKIRNGFISNSSSSSFIVAIKGDTLTNKFKTIKEEIKDKLKGYPFSNIIDEIYNTILQSAELIDLDNELPDYYGNKEEYLNDNPETKKLLKRGYEVYKVEVSSEDYENLGMYLYENIDSVNYTSPDKSLIITSQN